MPEPALARYRARDGTDHLVSVDRTPEGRWRVLDTVADRVIVVETLTGHDDRQAQARALALDYAAEQQAFQLGAARPRSAAQAAGRDRAGAAMGSVTAADPVCARGRQRAPGRQSERQKRDADRAPPARRPALPRAARRRPRVHRRAAARAPPRDPARDAARRHRRARRAHARARAAPTASSRSTAGGEPSTTCPAAPPADATGSRRCSRTPSRSSPAPTPRRRAGAGPREEAFVGVAPRIQPRAATSTRSPHSRFLWVDVDEPGELPALWALLAERPCHLLIESGGSGGAHAYWKLAEPLAATRLEPGDR